MKKLNILFVFISLFALQGLYAQTPAEAAPVPDVDAEKVISVFSDAYTNIDSEIQDWGQTTVVTTETVAGDNYLKITDLNYLPFVITGSVGIIDMQYIHLDVYTGEDEDYADWIRLTFTNWASGEESLFIDLPALTPNAWTSIDIDLDDFLSTGTSRGSLGAVKFEGNGKNICVDNIYLYYKTEVGSAAPEVNAPAPPARNAADVISVFSNTYANVVEDPLNTDDWGQSTVPSIFRIEGSNNDILKLSTFNYHPIPISINEAGADVSDMKYLHIDCWSTNTTTFNTVLNGNKGQEAVKAMTLIKDEWNSFDLDLLNDFTNVDLFLLMEIDYVFFKDGAGGNLFIDNLYFHNGKTETGLSNAKNTAFTVSSNPATDALTVKSGIEITSIRIFNPMGQATFSSVVNNSTVEINAAGMETGVYLLQAIMQNGETVVRKFVKK